MFIKDTTSAIGKVRITLCDIKNEEARRLETLIKEGAGDSRELIKRLHDLAAVKQFTFDNVVPIVGRQQIAKALTGQFSDIADMEVNYTALGTGTGTAVEGDTVLDTEVFRKAPSSVSYNANLAYFTAFYTAADCSGTYYEHGIFINGTGAADSGVMLSRVLIDAPTGVTKTALQSLTCEHIITFS